MIKTSYEIMHNGFSISPELNRDEYFKKQWIPVEEVKEVLRKLPCKGIDLAYKDWIIQELGIDEK